MKSLYAVLGVGLMATTEEIKTAYRRRAREVHPDVSSGNTETFQRLSEAYQILGDPRRRADYDGELRRYAEQTGSVLCLHCTAANRIRRPIPAAHRAVCGNCGHALSEQPPEPDEPVEPEEAAAEGSDSAPLDAARKVALRRLAGIADDLGEEAMLLVRDAALAGIRKLRNRFATGGK